MPTWLAVLSYSNDADALYPLAFISSAQVSTFKTLKMSMSCVCEKVQNLTIFSKDFGWQNSELNSNLSKTSKTLIFSASSDYKILLKFSFS